MSVGAICFTSSSSNGGCWVVLVFFGDNLLFYGKNVFFPYTTYTKRNAILRDLSPQKRF